MTNLEDLPLSAFTDELQTCMWDDDKFDPFLLPEVVDTTLDQLDSIRSNVRGQMQLRGRDDPAWYRRAARVATQADMRFRQTQRAVKNLNYLETQDSDNRVKKWADFAQQLGIALERSDTAWMLDKIMIDDDLPARRWLVLRAEQQTMKRQKSLERQG